MSVPYEQVSVAPLVLLSVLDHHQRTNTPENKRCLGVILGDSSTATVRITNSFALPFEEDEKNPDVWFLDHNYIETMNEMCKKIKQFRDDLDKYLSSYEGTEDLESAKAALETADELLKN